MVDVKNICFTGTRCEKCAHFAVCQFKGDYVKAQADIQFFRFVLFDGRPMRLDECEWAKPLKVDCKFYFPKVATIRDDAFSEVTSSSSNPSYYKNVQLTNSNKTESDE